MPLAASQAKRAVKWNKRDDDFKLRAGVQLLRKLQATTEFGRVNTKKLTGGRADDGGSPGGHKTLVGLLITKIVVVI